MKRILTIVTAALLVMACQESLEERCAREVQTYSKKHCPVRVTEDITMDSLSFDKSTHTLAYIYTVKGKVDDSTALNAVHPRELLLHQVKNSADLKLYKDAGYSFRYTYYSSKNKGTKLFEATFLEKDYR